MMIGRDDMHPAKMNAVAMHKIKTRMVSCPLLIAYAFVTLPLEVADALLLTLSDLKATQGPAGRERTARCGLSGSWVSHVNC